MSKSPASISYYPYIKMTLFFLIFLGEGFASTKNINIDEAYLLKESKKLPWQLKLQRANRLKAKLAYHQGLDQLDYNLTSKSYYKRTKEKSLSTFTPVTSPIQGFEVAIEKMTSLGIKMKAFAYTLQTTNRYTYKDTTSGVGLNFSFDLYRDIFGKLTRANLKKSELLNEREGLSEKISQHFFLIQIRKIYWSMVTNLEQQKILRQLLNSSIKQKQDAARRYKSQVADKGEVARYKSQVASRKSKITYLEYQYEKLLESLTEMLPSTKGYNLSISEYNLPLALKNLMTCTIVISSQTSTPYHFTYYDEIQKLLKQELEYEKIISKSNNSPNIFLNTEFKKMGTSHSHSKAIDDYKADGRNSSEISLSIKIPLGIKKNRSSTIQRKLHINRLQGEFDKMNSRLNVLHRQTIKYVTLLNRAIVEQNENALELEKTLTVSQVKYNQARISVRDLINDQDAFLNSNLEELNTRLTAISTILDYFTVFSDTPCPLNI